MTFNHCKAKFPLVWLGKIQGAIACGFIGGWGDHAFSVSQATFTKVQIAYY